MNYTISNYCELFSCCYNLNAKIFDRTFTTHEATTDNYFSTKPIYYGYLREIPYYLINCEVKFISVYNDTLVIQVANNNNK